MNLYRAVSRAEQRDIKQFRRFRTARNTLEGKQFFKTQAAISYFVIQAKSLHYRPPYRFLIEVNIEEPCLNSFVFDDQILDGFEAITINEDNLATFNNCVNFEEIIINAI